MKTSEFDDQTETDDDTQISSVNITEYITIEWVDRTTAKKVPKRVYVVDSAVWSFVTQILFRFLVHTS